MELNPALPETLNNLGVALGAVGKHKEAHPLFLEANRLRTDWPEARYNLAMSYMELGDKNDARKELYVLDRLDFNLAEKVRRTIFGKFLIDVSEAK